MAFESTAINDLVAGLQQKPLARESEDWLFGESEEGLFTERADATQIDPRAVQQTPEFDPNRAVSLPRPFAQLPYPAVNLAELRGRSPTTHVRVIDWMGIAKRLALPIGVLSIVIVVLGVYFAKTDETPAPTALAAAALPVEAAVPAADVAPVPAADVAPAPAPAVEPTPAPAVAPATAPAPAVAVSVEAVEEVEPAAAPVAPVAPVGAAAPVAAAAPVEPTADEKVNVEPGSPASRFLTPPPVETTIKTGAVKPAPAPTAVPELAAPLAPTLAAKPAAKRSAKLTTKPAAKSVARKTTRPTKTRATRKVVAAADAKPAGKGILQIASSPAMQVWVDGRNSKAMTPVRIRLLAGKHRISLLDNQRGTARSFDVVIKPDETTKVSKSF